MKDAISGATDAMRENQRLSKLNKEVHEEAVKNVQGEVSSHTHEYGGKLSPNSSFNMNGVASLAYPRMVRLHVSMFFRSNVCTTGSAVVGMSVPM